MTTSTLVQPKHLLFALVFSLFSFASLPSYATEPAAPQPAADMGDQSPMDGMHEQGMAEHDMYGHGHMADDLKLNDKQRELFKSAMKQMVGNLHSGKELHEQLRDLTESDSYDESKVRALVQKHNAEMENNMVNASKVMHEFYASLSAEQKTKFKEMGKHMKEKMKDHRKGHMDKMCDDEETDV